MAHLRSEKNMKKILKTIGTILYYIILFPLICLKNLIDPNFWAHLIGEKTGIYDKAKGSKFRQWANNLEGWRWWFWQIVGGGAILILLEIGLNFIGMTMLPWR